MLWPVTVCDFPHTAAKITMVSEWKILNNSHCSSHLKDMKVKVRIRSRVRFYFAN